MKSLENAKFKQKINGCDQLSLVSITIFEDLITTSLISVNKLPHVMLSLLKMWFGDLLSHDVINYMIPCIL